MGVHFHSRLIKVRGQSPCLATLSRVVPCAGGLTGSVPQGHPLPRPLSQLCPRSQRDPKNRRTGNSRFVNQMRGSSSNCQREGVPNSRFSRLRAAPRPISFVFVKISVALIAGASRQLAQRRRTRIGGVLLSSAAAREVVRVKKSAKSWIYRGTILLTPRSTWLVREEYSYLERSAFS
jgi:hypothetical protein